MRKSIRKYAIGLDLGGTNLKYIIADNKGKVLYKSSKQSFGQKSSKEILEVISSAIFELLEYAKIKKIKISAIGVGSPGTIDVKSGKVLGLTPNLPFWVGTKIKKNLQKKWKVPVYVDNDANLAGFGEAKFGAGKDYKNVVCYTIGTGIGGGIIIDGKIFRGSLFSAGEVGHVVVVTNGKKCNCGVSGCLEIYASANAISKRYYELSGKNVSAKEIFELWKKNDETAKKVVDETCEYLGTGISGIVNILNPEIIVIGGGVADAGDEFIKKIYIETSKRAVSTAFEKLKIVKAKLGNNAGALGAVALALNL
jgi:glucokinase